MTDYSYTEGYERLKSIVNTDFRQDEDGTFYYYRISMDRWVPMDEEFLKGVAMADKFVRGLMTHVRAIVKHVSEATPL